MMARFQSSTALVCFWLPCPCGLTLVYDIFPQLNLASQDIAGTDLKNNNYLFTFTGENRWWLHLNNNSITHIPSNAFLNLKGISWMSLKNNNISSMAPDALAGTEHSLEFLWMSNNNMREVPEALGYLRSISSITIDDNPINEFSYSIFKNISNSLNFLTIGSTEMKQWPTALQSLRLLTSLTIRHCPMSYFPESAFLGLEDNLGLLSIEYCDIQSLPVLMSNLRRLDVFSIDSNPYLTLSGITGEAFNSGTAPIYLSIRNSSFQTLPSIFHDARSITRVETNIVQIEYIDEALVPDDNDIQSVQLDDTRLKEFPKVISKMKNLNTLIIRGSEIHAIGSGSLSGLTQLTYLGIFDSPDLTDIADDVLNDSRDLEWFFLDNTGLTTIPRAIQGLVRLRNVSLQGNKVICSCETLGWLKTWNGSPGFFPIGNCYNIEGKDLGDYYRDDIPKCP